MISSLQDLLVQNLTKVKAEIEKTEGSPVSMERKIKWRNREKLKRHIGGAVLIVFEVRSRRRKAADELHTS